MSVAVLIPWRDVGCPYRARALTWVLARLATLGYPVVVGRHDDGPWCKALAVTDALSQTDADTLVIHDADCWASGLPDAVQVVEDGGAWSIPHRAQRGIFRLSERATTAALAGDEPDLSDLDERAYDGVPCGGVFVVRRDVYEDCPMDPRFTGFGGEDESLSWALRRFHGEPWRGSEALIHLYHPPQQRTTRRWGSEASLALRKRYARARYDDAAMRRLIEEGRSCLQHS